MITVLLFFIIAIMRMIQTVCNKRVSNELKNTKTFFLYSVYYQALAAVFFFFSLSFVGFKGLTFSTVVCAFVMAAFLMINFYANLNAIKGCKLIVCSMFSYGGLIVCCVLSWIMLGEKMSVLQGVGLVLFFLSAYMISSQKKETEEKASSPITKKVWLLLIVVTLSEGVMEVSQKYFSKRITEGEVAWFSFFMFLFSTAIMATGYVITAIKNRTVIKTNEPIQPLLQTQELSVTESEGVAVGKKRLNKVLLISGVLLAFSVFVINTLVTEMGKKISSVILFPVIALISICITVFVGWIIYKEKLTTKNIIGVILGLIAVFVLSVCTPETLSKIFS